MKYNRYSLQIKKYSLEIILVVCVASAAIAVHAYYKNFHLWGLSDQTNNWGTFGDYIGGVVGTIFSFTGVVLIYLTFKRQQETSVLQQFETTFFNLLNIQREMMKSVKGKFNGFNGEIVLEGGDFFEKFSQLLLSDYMFFPKQGSKEQTRKLICEYYEDRFADPGPTLGPYYRHLYHFLKYTNSSEIYGKKKKYMDIIQSQMSDAELYCLLYNAICYGSEKLLPLLDNYSFLENIERKSVSFDIHKRMFFPQTNFKYDTNEIPLSEIE